MISVIVCSKTDPSWTDHEKNIRATINTEYEYIRIDNRKNKYGICSAYNRGISRSKGNILVFIHEDVFFLEKGWGVLLEEKMKNYPDVGLIGLAGTQYLFGKNQYLETNEMPAWNGAGVPFTRGRIIQIYGNKVLLSVFNSDRSDSEVVATDGLFMGIRKSLFDKIEFDYKLFDGFHFYDLDICMQIRNYAKCLVTCDILVKHLSIGIPDDRCIKYGITFLNKWEHKLPASCCKDIPTECMSKGIMNYVLKKPLPLTILD